MKPSDAILFLSKIKRTEHNDVFESLIILAKVITTEGVQFDLDNDFEIEEDAQHSV